MSCLVRAPSLNFFPGKLTPFPEEMWPPLTIRQVAWSLFACITVSSTMPSSRKTRSPFLSCFRIDGWLIDTILWLPIILLDVRVSCAPSRSSTGSGNILPTLILGPGRSSNIPSEVFNSLETLRIKRIRAACSSNVPWERFSLATFIPPRVNRRSIAFEDVDGPMVQTILVFVFSEPTVNTSSRHAAASSNILRALR